MIWKLSPLARRQPRCLIALALALLVAGCAPGIGNVTGKVTYQGKPLGGVTVIFFDAKNMTLRDTTKADGSYSITKAAAGNAKIAILVPMDIPMKGMEMPGMGKGSPEKGTSEKGGGAGKLPTVPAKYADKDSSGLTCEVKAGNQQHDIILE